MYNAKFIDITYAIRMTCAAHNHFKKYCTLDIVKEYGRPVEC